MKTYKIKNTSRYLAIAGLYPGETKIINSITSQHTELRSKGLLSIEEITKESKNTTKENKDDTTIKSEVQ